MSAPRLQLLGPLALALAAWLHPSAASAFCRTTTCDPEKQDCDRDPSSGCLRDGLPLFWPSSCVTIGVHELGSPSNDLRYDDVAEVVEQAFTSWLQADCGDGSPAIEIRHIGSVECGVSEYNGKAGNTNVVLFREDDWPYLGGANAIALTRSRFNTETGELWDADIEVNATGDPISTGDPIAGVDLLSVLTHEAGHFLGLSHTLDQTATMQEFYNPESDGSAFRTLEPDDIAGICAVYPPDRKASTASCTNRHGFSAQCGADQPPPEAEERGCTVSHTGRGLSGSGPGGGAAIAALGLTLGLTARLRLRLRLRRRERGTLARVGKVV